ncbi:MAG: MBL fold metallo-hydrolase [Candidatus Kapaibacterium sp.]|nr:MAG: MBL fold metallo-hydrolase [Candidatus Kapabacteria bacterium]
MNIVPLDGQLPLKNDGALELFFIGTGSAFAQEHFHTNFLIIKGNDHILVDFGGTGPVAFPATTHRSASDVETLFVTHSHFDHVGGVEYLALLNRYIGMTTLSRPKLKMIINEQYQRTLWEMTLRGGMEWNEVNREGERLGFTDFFEIIRPSLVTSEPREVWQVQHGSIKLEIFRTNHLPKQPFPWQQGFVTYGVFIDDRVFFSGDTVFDTELIEMYATRSQYMFHDCSFMPNPVHASLPELRTLADDIKKKMFLVHYPDKPELHDFTGFAGLTKQGWRYILE